MKTLLNLSTAISLALTLGAPVYASTFSAPDITKSGVALNWSGTDILFTGQSSSRSDDDDGDDDNDDNDGDRDDDDRDDDRMDDNSDDSGRSKPRVPGGSGCDDALDILEHPECSIGTSPETGAETGGSNAGNDSGRRPRVPGGSGCDSLQDWIEHVECRR